MDFDVVLDEDDYYANKRFHNTLPVHLDIANDLELPPVYFKQSRDRNETARYTSCEMYYQFFISIVTQSYAT